MFKSIFIYSVIFFSITLSLAQSPTMEWAISNGGTSADQAKAITSDANGNVYVVGQFRNTVDFDPSSAVQNITSNGGYDIYIQKLDSNGNLIWIKTIGGIDSDNVNSIAIDSAFNIYIVGGFSNTVDFNPGVGVFNLTATDYNAYLLKLDTNGEFIYALNFGSNDEQVYETIAIDNTGNIYLGGYFYQQFDADPSSGVNNLVSNGASDAFVIKLNSNGDFIFAKNWGGSFSESLKDLTVDSNENIIITGEFDRTADFDPGAGVYNMTAVGIRLDIYQLKLDSNGGFLWAKQLGDWLNDYAGGVTTDSNNNIYTTGNFSGNVDFDDSTNNTIFISSGDHDVFIQKLDPDGNFIWAKHIAGSGDEESRSISIDNNGYVYIVGHFTQTADFNPGVLANNLTSNGNYDIFIQILTTDGDFIWAQNLGSSNDDEAMFVEVGDGNNFYVSGEFRDTVDFNPIGGGYALSSNGLADGFVMKLNVNTLLTNTSFVSENTIVFPNPFINRVNIDISEGISKIVIFDSMGRLVYENDAISLTNKNFIIDTNNLESGTYFLKLFTNSNQIQNFTLLKN